MYELEDRYWWFVARRELALELLRKHSQSEAKILDVGCGTGKGQESFAIFGEVYGIDFSEEALRFSHSRGLTRLLRADAEAIPYVSDSFDTVVSLDTIEHVPDDQAALSEIFRSLKPGGIFLMNVPAYEWLWGPHDVALMHQRRYHRSQLRAKLVDAGFEVERLSYHIFLLFPLVALSRFMGKFNKGEPEAKLPALPGWVETVLSIVQRVELRLISRFDLPWGSSLVAVARKPIEES
jgi:SAM-dependent methyltransferase